jgi:hypothetical protein
MPPANHNASLRSSPSRDHTMPISPPDRQRIINAVRAYIAKERISREEFAARTRLGKSTVDKLVVGIFSEKTVLQVDAQLGTSLLSSIAAAEFATEEVGKYTYEETKKYIGDYVFSRPSFRNDNVIHAFHMGIEWDRSAKALLVKEKSKNKKVLQFGTIYIPRASMHIFILSTQGGWVKSIILSQLDIYKRMKGLMLTMGRAFGNVYAPMAMPIIMNQYERVRDDMVGTITPDSTVYKEYLDDLSAVEQEQYAKWNRVGVE